MAKLRNENIGKAVLLSIGSSKGSGFIFSIEELIFVVTARHVLYKEINGNYLLISDLVTINIPTNKNDNDELRQIQVELDDSNTHHNTGNDVCVIHIGNFKPFKKEWKAEYTKKVNLLNSPQTRSMVYTTNSVNYLKDVTVTNDVFLFGFPTSLGKDFLEFFEINKPILRKGIVSYVNKSKRLIIIDCAVFAGNSGGPVLESYEDKDGQLNSRLIGLVSRYIPYKQEWYNIRDGYTNIEYVNSGYAAIIAMDVVIETIKDFQKRIKM